jgi:uncharacterized protein (DUF58 family)
VFRQAFDSLVRAWRRLRGWRRFKFTSGGLVFTGGAFSVGFAAINTGNNLLYLLVGSMLGFIVLSSWLSEKTIQRLEIQRRVPRGVTLGHPVRISYHVTNRKERIPTLATFLREVGLPESAFITKVLPGETVTVKSENHFVHRGVYPLATLTLSTAFPFGMFTKERDVKLPGELVIWPRSDRPVSLPLSPGGSGRPRQTAAMRGAPGARGEYRSLREYRHGDDPRDIHWRSTARRGQPVVKEYDLDAGEALWLCLDTQTEPGIRAERAIETVASLAALAMFEGKRFAVATPHRQVEPGHGSGHLERVLDLLARVDMGLDQPDVSAPADPMQCVLVSANPSGRRGFGTHVRPGVWKAPAGVPK